MSAIRCQMIASRRQGGNGDVLPDCIQGYGMDRAAAPIAQKRPFALNANESSSHWSTGFIRGKKGDQRMKKIPMKTSRFSGSQIVAILGQAASGVPVPALRREHGISSTTFYKRRSRCGGMDASKRSRDQDL